jgi:hypothetical protein
MAHGSQRCSAQRQRRRREPRECKCATGDNWDLAVCEASKAGETTTTAAVRRSTAQLLLHRVGAAQQLSRRGMADGCEEPRSRT